MNGRKLTATSFLATVSATALIASAGLKPAVAQESAVGEPSQVLEEVIVTGVARAEKKFEATFSINTLDAEDMQILAPRGTADLLGNIPGFFPEGGTAGETHNNVLVRGLPQAGGFRYVPNLIDGLPAYEESEAPFMNNDVFIKTDLMTKKVEAVKGGPGGILYSNALGSAVNYVTRTGGQEFEGAYKLEVGDWGPFVRNEAYISGPITDSLTFAVGGFYRIADGIRDPGYTGDNGGQIRGNLQWTSDDDRTQITLHVLNINDKTNFYQNIPFSITNPSGSGTEADPFRIRPSNVKSLGIDFGRGTSLSPQTSFYQLFNPDGSQLDLDIRDGIHPKFNILTAEFEHNLGEGWRVGAKLRYNSGSNGFNALFEDPPLETSIVAAQQLKRVQNDLNPTLTAAYAGATDVIAVFTDTLSGADLSTAERAPAFLANNVPVFGLVDATNFTADLQLGKEFDLGWSAHELTIGGYTSRYTYDVSSVFARAFSDLSENARLVDLFAVDANLQQVGPSITSNGVIEPAIFGLGADSDQITYAVYALDSMSFLDDRLKVDAGVRWQRLEIDRVTTNSFDPGNSSEDFTPADVVVGSTQDTLADNFVNVPDGVPRFASDEFDAFGWSIGANYLVTDTVAVYATVADSFRMPSFEDFVFGGPATNPATGEIARGDLVEDIFQLEGGVRLSTNDLDLSTTFFYIDFKAKENLGPTLINLDTTGAGGVSCAVVPAPADCPVIRDRFRRSLKNKGFEIEGKYQPSFFPGLVIEGSVVWHDPKQGQDQAIRSGIEQFDSNGDGINDSARFIVSTTDKRRPRRQPRILLNVRPSYTFQAFPLTLYGQVFYYGERFASDDTANVTVYPAYTQVNAGFVYKLGDNVDLQVHVANLNDGDSFTEGSNVTPGLEFTNGDFIGVARPLLGRTYKGSLTYRF
ncbi:MAG: TonB-dependent receptor [Alphaproteobacteria bacterium]|nr:MAG: TonB-dependent receptor [Alphaproteobacteria bacterium]